MLPSFNFQPEYIKPKDDLQEFYASCFSLSNHYDRATGYFSELIFQILWEQIISFTERNGKIRLLCSPLQAKLGQEIDDAYQKKTDSEISQEVIDDFKKLLESPVLESAGRALAGLIVAGILEVKFVTPKNARGIFHHKEGMFKDDEGNKILFKGSMNETFRGLDSSGNLEHIDIFTNWESNEGDQVLISSFEERFEAYWEDEYPDVKVTAFPDAARLFVAEITAEYGSDWKEFAAEAALEEEKVKEILANRREEEEILTNGRNDPIGLWEHQAEALKVWEENNFHGVFEHATGSGKTRTAIKAIRDHSETGGHTLVVVPTQELLAQWDEALKEFKLPNQKIRLCGSGKVKWRERLFHWLNSSDPQVVVAIQNTASTDDFIFLCNRSNKPLLVVGDEVHNLGAPTFKKIFNIESDKRLGLSATPERSDDGTQAILNYFGYILHKYEIQDAIRDKRLVNYLYEPKIVQLDSDEQEEWNQLTTQIGQKIAIHGSWDAAQKNDDFFFNLVITRSRIGKKAAGKIPAAVHIFSNEVQSGQRWLFYCEDTEHMKPLVQGLKEVQSDLDIFEFHSAMEGDREATLREFEDNGGVLVSCGILDEGVNIPDASHALILASSQNRREYIQRRGRVLRLSKDGSKSHAKIYDVLVVPQAPVKIDENRLIGAELARSLEFCEYATNSDTARLSLLTQLVEYDISIQGFDSHFGLEEEGLETEEGLEV